MLTKQIGRVLQGITQVGLAVRGFYGEGSQIMGNFFQISNQTTLGQNERETIDSLERVTKQIIDSEQRARDELLKDARVQIEDKIWRVRTKDGKWMRIDARIPVPAFVGQAVR